MTSDAGTSVTAQTLRDTSVCPALFNPVTRSLRCPPFGVGAFYSFLYRKFSCREVSVCYKMLLGDTKNKSNEQASTWFSRHHLLQGFYSYITYYHFNHYTLDTEEA